MEYLTVREVAMKWNLSERRLQTMCNEGLEDFEAGTDYSTEYLCLSCGLEFGELKLPESF